MIEHNNSWRWGAGGGGLILEITKLLLLNVDCCKPPNFVGPVLYLTQSWSTVCSSSVGVMFRVSICSDDPGRVIPNTSGIHVLRYTCLVIYYKLIHNVGSYSVPYLHMNVPVAFCFIMWINQTPIRFNDGGLGPLRLWGWLVLLILSALPIGIERSSYMFF